MGRGDDRQPGYRKALAAAWIASALLIALLVARDLSLVHANGRIGEEAVWGRDFANLWTGGQLLNLGRIADVYDVPAYQAFQHGLFGPLGPHNYSYPPLSFAIAELFGRLPYFLALALWLGGTAALFLWAARPWWPRAIGPLWLAILTPAAIVNVWAGHYGFLLGALFLAGWASLRRAPWLAGILFGLMLLKPHLAVLVPLLLLLRGEWRTILSGAVTVGLLIGLTSLRYGMEPWAHFLTGTSRVQAGLIEAGPALFGTMSTSLATAILRFSDNWAIALSAQALLAAATVAALIVAVRRKVSTPDLAMLAATGTFLVLPYAFNYDLTVVMIAALRLAADPRADAQDRRWAIAGFAAPVVGMALAMLQMPLMPLMLALLFAAQLRSALRDGQPAIQPRYS